MCWFIKSLRLGDRTGFTGLERAAADDAGILPSGAFFVASCEDRGKLFYQCLVMFGGTVVGTFEVVPANASTDADGYYVEPDAPAARYSVLTYRGSR